MIMSLDATMLKKKDDGEMVEDEKWFDERWDGRRLWDEMRWN